MTHLEVRISRSRSETPVNHDPKTPLGRGKKRKRTLNCVEQMENLLGKIIKMQEESKKNHLKLKKSCSKWRRAGTEKARK